MTRLLYLMLLGTLLCSAPQRSAAKNGTWYFHLFAQQLPAPTCGYDKLVLIDRRADTGDYGAVQSSFGSRPLRSALPLQTALRSLDSQCFLPAGRSAATLVVLLRETRVAHQQGILSSNFRAELFLLEPGGAGCRPLFNADFFRESIIIDGMPDRLLSADWEQCLRQASDIALEPPRSSPQLSLAALDAYADSAGRSAPAYKTGSYPRGIYFSHESFLRLEPDERGLRIVRSASRPEYPVSVFIADKDAKGGYRQLASSDFYAACDGKQWYKPSMETIGLMWKEDGEFYCRGMALGLPGTPGLGQSVALGVFTAAMLGSARVPVLGPPGVNPAPVKTAYRFRLSADGQLIPVKRL